MVIAGEMAAHHVNPTDNSEKSANETLPGVDGWISARFISPRHLQNPAIQNQRDRCEG